MANTVLTQTDTDLSQSYSTQCYTAADGDASVTMKKDATDGGTAGSTEVVVDITKAATVDAIFFGSGALGSTNWLAGVGNDVTYRFEVTTANTSGDLSGHHCIGCRMNSSGVSQALYCTDNLNWRPDLTTTGVKSRALTTAIQSSPAATDWLLFLQGFTNAGHANQTLGVTPSQNIDLPFGADAGATVLTDSLDVADGSERAATLKARLLDLLATDDVFRAVFFKFTLEVEALDLTDATDAARMERRNQVDMLGVLDALEASRDAFRLLAEAVTVTDYASYLTNYGLLVVLEDALVVLDEEYTSKGRVYTAADVLEVLDSVTTQGLAFLVRNLAEALALADSEQVSMSLGRVLDDLLDAEDAASAARSILRAGADGVETADGQTLASAMSRHLLTGLDVVDTERRAAMLLGAMTDSLLVADAQSDARSLLLQVADALETGDRLDRASTFERALLESVLFNDAMSANLTEAVKEYIKELVYDLKRRDIDVDVVRLSMTGIGVAEAETSVELRSVTDLTTRGED